MNERRVPLEELVLVRLLAAPAQGLPLSSLRTDLAPVVATGMGVRELREALGPVVDRLASAAEIEWAGRGRARPTASGRRRAHAFLGVADLPSLRWPALRDTYLVARALGLAPPDAAERKRLAGAGGLRAAILRKQHDLPLGEYPTLAQVVDALLWKQLGVETTEKLTLPLLRKHLLNRMAASSRAWDAATATRQLAAQAVGAPRIDAPQLRHSAFRGLLERSTAERSGADGALDQFASDVLRAARSCATGRYGDNKVFIHHVWRSFSRKQAIDEETFKARLVEANHQRLLDLSRADLVEAMNPADVASSETRYLTATFHFVRIDSERKP